MTMHRYLFILILLCSGLVAEAQHISRIEPPHWWTGMHNPAVQLMVHGEDIADMTPQITHTGIEIRQLHQTGNPNFLFIDLHIHPKSQTGPVEIAFYSGRTQRASYRWHLHERDPGSATRQGFNSADVVYLITPDRFANGDPANDAVDGMKEMPDRSYKGGRHGGDIAGIRKHLDYIHDMGFTALWLNPVLENDMTRSSYHGYSTTDYYKVDPRFGTNEDFRALVQEGLALGIKHIMDMIPNHCGSEHWWMSDLPADDWVNTWGTYTQTNHRKTVVSDPYASGYDTEHFTDGWFVRSMPDLNQRNPFLATYLIQNAIWWIEYLGLAGLRIDTHPYSDPDFITEYCRRILEEYPNLNITGEQWHTVPAIVAYWQKGVVNKNGYVSHLPNVMDFPLHSALIRSLHIDGGWEDPWVPVYEMLAQDFLYADPMNMLVFPDNHDMSRIYTQMNEDETLYKLALAFILTTRGIPQIFYGTEILMSHPGTDEHVIIRSDFPGGWPGDAVNAFTGTGLTPAQSQARQWLRKLLHWRQTADAVHTGKLMHFAPKDKVYVYFRYSDTQKVMVILNRNKEPYTLSLAPFAEMLDGHTQGNDVMSGVRMELDVEITLQEAGAYVVEIR